MCIQRNLTGQLLSILNAKVTLLDFRTASVLAMKWKAQQNFHVHQSRHFLCRGASCFTLTGLQKYPKTLSRTFIYFRWGKSLLALFVPSSHSQPPELNLLLEQAGDICASSYFQVPQTGSMFSSPHYNKGVSPEWKSRISPSCQVIPCPIFHSTKFSNRPNLCHFSIQLLSTYLLIKGLWVHPSQMASPF